MGINRSILVVEDEPAISQLVAFHLEEHGYEPIVVAEGLRALALLEKSLPALMILDLMLPDIDGIEILRRVRSDPKKAKLPVIILTAKGDEPDRVRGLEIGADDYVPKPFSPRELMLRLEKILSVREGVEKSKLPERFGCLEVDEDRFRVTVEGKTIEISATEMRLLTELLRNRGKVLSRQILLQNAWGFMPNVTPRTIDTHIKRLRQKLGAAAAYIETIRGVGYRWVETPPEESAESQAGKAQRTVRRGGKQ
ncbi:MAG: DNA-binding response regulator [Candidatus Hydrogenedentota bacterium]|uniref:Phosphate regulon transcriptional regulatory protein PhoB (SphR) n=1 Tax=Sumerlaea chitinivorans TaxID=2250252 RepID=A0A2Z4Y4V3_SUMC1|nr:Phosphate regulon transcriptional regulatory protein PhoB (SphR) [Candidatus Sumerlaea chitinivorans]MCX7964899.1 response regulator transcription factor [Candidatus Sumerlaea chitinivorans]RMH27666.1 MAG: DNA-binding response regulator [Candidatus Hydrogenedentota bacterium]GIX44037.1 MAG: DNA-binding response regulator [Candidatus Sumerlaea sp.]